MSPADAVSSQGRNGVLGPCRSTDCGHSTNGRIQLTVLKKSAPRETTASRRHVAGHDRSGAGSRADRRPFGGIASAGCTGLEVARRPGTGTPRSMAVFPVRASHCADISGSSHGLLAAWSKRPDASIRLGFMADGQRLARKPYPGALTPGDGFSSVAAHSPVTSDSGPSRTAIPTHRGQRSGDCGQFLTSV
jgi:hypothetical protein